MPTTLPNSQLQLKRHYVTELRFKAEENTAPDPHEIDVLPELSLGHSIENQRDWRVALTVRIRVRHAQKEIAAGLVTFVGLFNVAESVPAENMQRFVAVNGATLLYGAAREIILNLTARSTQGVVVLPSVSFHSLELKPLRDAEEVLAPRA